MIKTGFSMKMAHAMPSSCKYPMIHEDQYGVDLVRHAQDEHGLLREQRLTLAQYNSYGEAEEHFYEAEQQMQDTGLEDFDVDALATMPYSDTPTILTAHFPPDATGDELATTNCSGYFRGWYSG